MPSTRPAAALRMIAQVSALFTRFVAKHKAIARPGVRGYKEITSLSDLENPLLQHHRADESIQDKSLDARMN
jgi:hypothetical protein